MENLDQGTMEINGQKWKKVVEHEDLSNYKIWIVGESYHIETYTKYYTGTVVGETDTHILLNNACYIASTGRFMDYVSGADPSESEPFPQDLIVRVRKDSEVGSITRDAVLVQI